MKLVQLHDLKPFLCDRNYRRGCGGVISDYLQKLAAIWLFFLYRFEGIREEISVIRSGLSRDDRMLRWKSPPGIRDLLDADKIGVVAFFLYANCRLAKSNPEASLKTTCRRHEHMQALIACNFLTVRDGKGYDQSDADLLQLKHVGVLIDVR
ncbi:hypothetical protein OIU85_012078 [Salix viminalis]|uniref:Uncharacterized protein n=1 Tax=Salix viminalis TaxID=40686 RepID=A0A9Q0NU64_SALVM|nr:hypothetical protein OIU85_012078 [Salix viminalis]